MFGLYFPLILLVLAIPYSITFRNAPHVTGWRKWENFRAQSWVITISSSSQPLLFLFCFDANVNQIFDDLGRYFSASVIKTADLDPKQTVSLLNRLLACMSYCLAVYLRIPSSWYLPCHYYLGNIIF